MLNIYYILQANRMLKETKIMKIDIKFQPPPRDVIKVVIKSFVDAAFYVTQRIPFGKNLK